MNESYFNLVREFPLVPLKDEAQYDAAVSFLKALAVRDEDKLDAGETAYLDALTQFVGDYEEQHHRIEAGGMIEYKGYMGKVEFDPDAHILYGEVIGIRDVVTFQGSSVAEIEKAFKESVDDYLKFCRERGEQPDKP